MADGQWLVANTVAKELTDTFPDYSLGHYLLAETHRVAGSASPYLQSPVFTTRIVDLLLEARARASNEHSKKLAETKPTMLTDPATRALPSEMIQVGTHTDHLVYVDLESSALYLYDTSGTDPVLLRTHYVSSGKGGYAKSVEGDLKTPLGVYRIHGFRSDDSLPALYGSGALMLNYPNVLDRSLGRTGSGIWLHGIPRSDRSRSPRSSEGCVTMANDHLLALHQQIDMSRTHVVLADKPEWIGTVETQLNRDRFQELFHQYRGAWLNSRIGDLVTIYSPDALPAQVANANTAAARKVSNQTRDLHSLAPVGIDLAALELVKPSDVSLLFNPTENPDFSHLVMEFELAEQNAARITLYWEKAANGYWRIKRERIDTGGA